MSESNGNEAAIQGTGHYVPDQVIHSNDLEERFDLSDGWIVKRTGIEERRAVTDETTGTMAIHAGRAAIRSAGLQAKNIGLTLLATSTPDKPLPPTAPSVQHELEVRGGAFDIAGSCVGFLDALSTGAQYIRTGQVEHVLVIGANHLTYRVNPDDLETACLFGDGAGAVVLGSAESESEQVSSSYIQLEGITLGSDGSVDSLDVPAGGSKEPFTPDAWEANRHLMRMVDGGNVFKLAVRKQVEMGEQLLNQFDLTPTDVDWLLPHQANQKIMTSVTRQLDVPGERLLSNIDRYGNTSAASIPILLDEVRKDDRLNDEDRILMTAFGCGIRYGAALLTNH